MDYAVAVQVLRDSGQSVNLVVKRRVVLPPAPNVQAHPEAILQQQNLRVCLTRNKKKEDFGIVLGCKIYVKEIVHRTVADKEGSLQEGDFVHKINGSAIDGLTLKEARKLLETSKDTLDLAIKRDSTKLSSPSKKQNGHADAISAPNHHSAGDRTSAYSDLPPPRPPLPPMDDGKTF